MDVYGGSRRFARGPHCPQDGANLFVAYQPWSTHQMAHLLLPAPPEVFKKSIQKAGDTFDDCWTQRNFPNIYIYVTIYI